MELKCQKSKAAFKNLTDLSKKTEKSRTSKGKWKWSLVVFMPSWMLKTKPLSS